MSFNGLEQVRAMAKLMNSEQQAPAWQPSEIGGIKVGDAVRLPNIEATFEVIAISDPLLTLRAPSGRELKAGWRAVQRVRVNVSNPGAHE